MCQLTFKDGVHGREVRADGHDNHGKGEGEELDDDIPASCQRLRCSGMTTQGSFETGLILRWHRGLGVRLLAGPRAGDVNVIFVEDGLLGRNNPSAGHVEEWISKWWQLVPRWVMLMRWLWLL